MINGWHYKSAWQTMRACRKAGIPVMVRSDSHLHTQRSGLKRIAKWPLYSWFIPRLDACLAVGQWSRDYFLHYGAEPQRVFIVPHVVDTDYFRSESNRLQPQRTIIRAQWGLDNDVTVMLFAGKFIEKKRPLDFVRAITEAANRGSRVAGLMVGDGPLNTMVVDYVKSHNAPIRFAGFLNQSKMTEAYVASDWLVLPSDGGETWGLVVNEAMTCGLPCLVSDQVGSGPDLAIPGETGYVFPTGQIDALADLVQSVADSTESLAVMREKARNKANEYSVAIAVERLLNAVQAVNA
jgi:glycosyltransferase involved in cell wall biosynthesis